MALVLYALTVAYGFVACGGSSDQGGSGPETGTGTSDATVDRNEASSSDDRSRDANGASDSDSAVLSSPPWLSIVNASPDFGSMYICLSWGAATPNVSPSAVFPFLPQNGGASSFYRAPPPYDALDLTSLNVTVYAVPQQVAEAATGTLDGGAAGCADLIGGSEAASVGTISAGQLHPNAAYLVFISGCSANDDSGAPCGSDYDGGSTLGLRIAQVDNTSVPPNGDIGVQFAQASIQLEAYARQVNATYGGTVGELLGAGSPTVLGVGVLAGPVVPSTVVMTPVPAPEVSFGARALLAGGAGSGVGVSWPTAMIQDFTYGTTDAGTLNAPPGGFLTKGNWTFVLVGDPQQSYFSGSEFNPLGLHILGLPNQPLIDSVDSVDAGTDASDASASDSSDAAGPFADASLPPSVDWRTKGAVGSVQNGGWCRGGLVAIAVNGALEGNNMIQTGTLARFSTEYLVDCAGLGCFQPGAASSVAIGTPLIPIMDFPYTSTQGDCPADAGAPVGHVAQVTPFPPASDDDLMGYVSTTGPLYVEVHDDVAFQTYRGGTYEPPPCFAPALNSWPGTLVGYTDTYWIVRMPFGTSWGSSGYVYIKKGPGICAFSRAVQFVTGN
jgi:hypothetical protein